MTKDDLLEQMSYPASDPEIFREMEEKNHL